MVNDIICVQLQLLAFCFIFYLTIRQLNPQHWTNLLHKTRECKTSVDFRWSIDSVDSVTVLSSFHLSLFIFAILMQNYVTFAASPGIVFEIAAVL